jgi:Protein kinase domain/PQQ-like domain
MMTLATDATAATPSAFKRNSNEDSTPLPPTQQPTTVTTASLSTTDSSNLQEESDDDVLLLDFEDEDEENDTERIRKATVELSDASEVIVVALVDGTLAGLDRSTGRTLWKREASDTNCPLVQPLIATTTTVKAEDRWRTAAIPSILDGKVYLTTTTTTNPEDGAIEDCTAPNNMCSMVEDTVTASIRNLVHRAPFVDYHRGGRIYTASRQSVAVAVDRRTGATLRTIASGTTAPDVRDDHVPTDVATGGDALWLGRVDYTISIHEPLSGELDVQFTMAEMMSIQDMLLTDDDSSHRQLLRQYLLPQNRIANAATSHLVDDPWLSLLPNVIVATPRGNVAYRNPNTGEILWVAEETFDTPIVYAFDAHSGRSLSVDMVPDTVTPHGSTEHVSMEMQRQLQKSALATFSHHAQYAGGGSHYHPHAHLEAAQPVFGVLRGSGQIYAIPLRAGRPVAARDPLRHMDRLLLPDGHAGGAVVPFYHPDYGYHYVPPEHFYTLQPQRHRRYKKLWRLLGSWLLPLVAFLFVTVRMHVFVVCVFYKFIVLNFFEMLWQSFELGRRKRLSDEQVASARLSAIPGKYPEHAPSDEGIIQVDESIVLGHGGHGTVVYKGMLEGRPVAVKRMLKTYHASADREISLLIESDGHPNVVRYHLKEVRGDFVFLALELCDLSLHDLIGHVRGRLDRVGTEEEKKKLFTASKAILFQVTKGVEHLHRLRIVHRDLKPANILLADARNQNSKKHGPSTGTICDIFERGGYVAKVRCDMAANLRLPLFLILSIVYLDF